MDASSTTPVAAVCAGANTARSRKPAYYNDNDPYCAQWLRNLIAAGHLPAGEVDERPVQAVRGDDLGRFGQCHFFAGIGGWPLALRLAGWPDDRDVWTGSCPCQPFSAAGKRQGTADARHLWPEFARLIGQCRPANVLGEQVASKDGRLWLAGVRADLEALGYAVGASDLCAAGTGAPHIRQRLYWVADAAYTEGARLEQQPVVLHRQSDRQPRQGLGDTDRARLPQRQHDATEEDRARCSPAWQESKRTNGRRVKPGVRLLVDGIPNRVGRLRGYGNAIVPQVAAEFVSAFMECRP